MLVDIRHEPTRDDKQMFKYILYYAIPYTLIATKADKLAKTRRKQAAVARARELGAPPYAIAYSSETGDGKQELLERLEAVAYGDIIGNDSETEADSNPSAPAAETISASKNSGLSLFRQKGAESCFCLLPDYSERLRNETRHIKRQLKRRR